MIHSSIWYQFEIHPRPSTGAEKAIFAEKYNILMTCILLFDTCYSINFLLELLKKVGSVSIYQKNDFILFPRSIIR